MIFHARTILGASTTDQHDGMLLYIMAYHHHRRHHQSPAYTKKLTKHIHIHTFTGNIRSDDFIITQAHPRDLPISRIGFLGVHDRDLETYGLHARFPGRGHGGRNWLARGLRVSRTTDYLVEGRAGCGGSGEAPEEQTGERKHCVCGGGLRVRWRGEVEETG